MDAGNNPSAGRKRSLRWPAALVAGALVMGGLATTASAQAPPAEREPTPVEPPVDNVFPVPLPHEVSFADSWHACRDGCDRQHKGNDLMAGEGTPAVAVEAGVIAKVDNTDDGNGGLSLWLVGESGVAYYYAHNAENLVAEGQRVTRSQMIARVGHTGNARTTPPHIHFQVNLCGELSSAEPCTVDPHPYLQRWAQGQIDGGADGVGWYQASTGAFGQRTEAGSSLPSFPFGTVGATDTVPVSGDWDGDGRDSVGLYQRADATFHLRDDEGAPLAPLPFGQAGRTDVWPVAGDFDGDGRDTVGLYRQAEATFVVLVDLGVESAPVTVGTPGRADALPVVGDWDGDGRDSIGVYRQSDGSVSLIDDDGTAVEPATAGAPAGPDTFPVGGDWDGDGRDSVGVLHRTAAEFVLPVPNPLDPAAVLTVAVEGGADVLPVAGDWNGRDLVTLDELRQIYGTIPDEAKVVEGLPGLNAAMLRAGISTPARKAAFLATIRSESGFRYDAVEGGSDRRYRGRGFIQLTGDFNYRSAGEFLGLDLLGDPDLAINPLASPAIAAWYWTVARDINLAADELDMAAVNIAIGFAPSVRRDMLRCGDFMAALRYYSGGTVPEGVNCERNAQARLLALASFLPAATGSAGGGAPSGAVSLPPSSIPDGWVPPTTGTTAPPDPATLPPGTPDPAAPTRPPTSSTTVPVPPRPPTTATPTTGTPTTGTPTTGTPTTGTPTTSTPTTGTPTTATPTTGAPSTTAPGSTTTVATDPTTTSPPPTSVDPDGSTTTTLFDGG